MIKVIANNLRPDFRVFVDLLFGYGRDVDSDGDAFPVFSREWRELYLKDRESDEPPIEICAEELNPLEFKIESKSQRLEELASIYLYQYCGDSMSIDGLRLSQGKINELNAKYSGELNRAIHSIWHSSNENNPYPNTS